MNRLLCALLLLALAPNGVVAETRPNVLLVNAEDIGPALGCYGHPDAVTPHLDGLAKRGVLFRNAFATAPLCAPARSCLITGLHATTLGTQHLRSEVERPKFLKTVPELLREAGYFTASSWKTDYNFVPKGVWDLQSNEWPLWRKRKSKDQPFFVMLTLGCTHEGRVNRTDRYEQEIAKLPNRLHRDPKSITLLPYWPDTPRTRELWARQHNLITLMDRQVGAILEMLDDDGLTDETIVIFIGDHGYGLPRAKRWLNDSGLRVPLIVAYGKNAGRDANRFEPGTERKDLVDFRRIASAILHHAGVERPEWLAPVDADTTHDTIFAHRDRADDVFECSRAVHDGKYLYVRHYVPHLPYIQGGKIFSDEKDSYRELRRLHEAGELPEHAQAMWAPRKPIEELYDLENDPHELNNLAVGTSHEHVLKRLRPTLRKWILATRDTGFLTEAEYQIRSRAAGVTPYELCQDEKAYDLERIRETAEMVGRAEVPVPRLLARLDDEDSGVRYWAATALLARRAAGAKVEEALAVRLDDDSPSVRIAAARTLAEHSAEQRAEALELLGTQILDPRPWVALEATRAAHDLGPKAEPLVPVLREVVERNRSAPGSPRPWKDFNYAAFTTWAAEAALENCGETADVP